LGFVSQFTRNQVVGGSASPLEFEFGGNGYEDVRSKIGDLFCGSGLGYAGTSSNKCYRWNLESAGMKARHLAINEKTDSVPTVYRERTLGPRSDWWVSVHLYNSTDLLQKLLFSYSYHP